MPAPEGTRARGKRGATVLAAALTVLLGTAQAGPQLPTGGQVTAGAATLQQSGAVLNIQQTSRNAAIDWQQFSIGAGGTVRFDQPSSASIALNRVVGQDPSQIMGSLQANGQVFLVNPSGVLFGQGAQVSTAGLLASTRDISSADFASGNFRFSGSGNGRVVNQGTLTAGQGGYVALIGAQVVNAGTIQAPGGDVRLAAADAVSVRIDGAGLAGFTVERGTLDGLVSNHGLIQAEGGRVVLTADAADALARAVVNHDGIIEAQAVAGQNGTVELRADAQVGRVDVAGRIDVSSASGTGGTAIATAHAVNLAGTAAIDASGATGGGTVLVGGGWQGRDAGISNASTVTMAPGARIDVSARDQGNGGTAVLWSEDGTAFAGEIAARGGSRGGAGGKVETSSHDQLQAIGSVDASAAAGEGGQWLLDPRNVTIAASGANGTGFAGSTAYNGSTTFTPGADSVILASTIVNSLNAGANVTITTGTTGTSAGDITVAAPIVTSGDYNLANTLQLLATRDVNVNARIANTSTVYNNRLNVVLTPGGSGSVNFSSAGNITTRGGNVYVGSVSGTGYGEAVSKAGQNLTMTAGSYIDVAGGIMDAKVNGTISLAANSLRNSGGSAYYNSDPYLGTLTGSQITLTGTGIVSTNTDAAVPDIRAQTNVSLSGASVGSSANPIKIAGYNDNGYSQLSLYNAVGNSYVNEIEFQAFRTINVAIGSQASSTQDIRLLNDFGGDGHSGTGHLLLNTDKAGVLNLATGDVATATPSSNRSNNVQISAGNITFADGSVNTGAGYFRAVADNLTASAAPNNVADILAPDVYLFGRNIGTQARPLELSSGATTSAGALSIANSGGSTFIKSVDNNFTNVSLTHEKSAGTHSVLFAGGDHLDYTTNGTNLVTPTISGGASDGSTFGATTGLDATRRNRNVAITANSGGVVYGDDSVNLGYGRFSTTIANGNATGTIAAQNLYDPNAKVAQITAGDVTFNASNMATPGVTTIGAGGRQVQIAQGLGARDNTLSVNTQQGNVAIQELTTRHFKTVSVNLGSASAAQSVAIGLAGADDINFSDSGSLVSVDAAKVAVSDGNRNFSLAASARSIQIDGQSLTTGSYTVNAGNLLRLNGDIATNGGTIQLNGGNGVDLLRSVRIDSNSDRSGNGGSVTVGTYSNGSGSVSGTGAGGQTLTIDTSSADSRAGSINAQVNVDARSGGFLGGMTLNAAGVTRNDDGYISLGTSNGTPGNILLKGDFSATGRTTLNSYYGFNLDTEQGNTGAGGNITFAGASLSGNGYYAATTFNTSTTRAGANGGNITLATQNLYGGDSLNVGGLTADARSGSGGTSGDITLGRVNSYSVYGGPGTQNYYGRTITLNGDLSTTGNGVGLTGDVRLAKSVTIDTNSNNSGASGGVGIAGAVSASVAGAGLIIDTTSPDASGGSVLVTGGAGIAGGQYLKSLDIRTANGTSGTAGSIALNAAVATEGAQTYSGGTLTTTGGMSTNGGTVDLRNVAGVTLAGTTGAAYAITTDRAGGTNAAGALLLGTKALNGNYALNIDTTADGGGAAADLALAGVGATTAFSSINVAARNVTLNGATRASGPITVEARGAGADLAIASTGSVVTTGASNIVLAAGRNFANSRGAGGVAPGTGGRYLVYSSNPADSVEGLAGYSKHYNQGYASGSTPTYAGSGNWFLYSVAPVITVASNAATMVYGNADPSLTLAAGNYSGFIDGDTRASLVGNQTLTLAAPGTLSGAGYRQVGNYTYTINGVLTDSLGYQYAPFAQSLAVTPRDLAISGISAANRVYDGTTAATLTGTASATGLVGDIVTADAANMAGSFANANAGVGKTVAVNGIVIGGADSANYNAVQPLGVTADIERRTLSITGSAVVDKTYDGGVVANVAAGTLGGLIGSETLGVNASGTYADKNAGSGKTVGATYALVDGGAGGLAANYTLAGENLTGAIAQRALTVAATGVNKVYDGGLAASVLIDSTDRLAGDILSYTGAAEFADKNVGTGKVVGVTGIALGGLDAGNYVLTGTQASTTANITPKSITVAAAGVNRVYDGTTAASADLSSAGVIGQDAVAFTGKASFADKNVGTGKVVSVTGIASSGADAGNYTLFNSTAKTKANVTAKAITVAATGVDRVYDGTTQASANLASTGVVGGDTVVFGGIAAFVDKNAGAGKTVNVSGIAASGTDAGNYSLNATKAATTATITPKAISVDATGVNRVYDGSTVASANLSSSGLIGADAVTFGGTASFADKNVGTGKVVSVAGIASGGADAGNYSLINTTATTKANVTPKSITVDATGVNRVYDGTTQASANLASAGVVGGDTVVFGGTASFADKNAGAGKTVNVSGIAASGTDAGNYSLTRTTAATTASIAQKAITVAAAGVNRIYDGSIKASTKLSSTDVVSGDTVSFFGSSRFADKNVGTGKTVSVTGIGSGGTDAGNYVLNNTTASTTADIAAKAITVAAAGVDRVYDGTTDASARLSSSGVVGGDTVAFTGTATLADKNVGTGKTVSVAGIASSGTDAGNYTLINSTATTKANVTAKAITVDATGVDRVYDGTTKASANLASGGVVGGDVVAFTGTASLADKNVGTAKTVSVVGIGSNGTDAGNYTLVNTTASTTADVTAKAITVDAAGVNRVYDGTTQASAVLSSGGVVGGDVVAFDGTATLADKNVGTGKVVSVAGIGSSGTDAGNYTLVNTTASTTADVTPKAITVAATGVNKVYDGGTGASADLASAGVVAGDTVVFDGTASFADKNVGVDKTVAVNGIAASGTDAGNYSLDNTTASTTASIARKAIDVAAAGVDRVYDGSTRAGADLASAGVVTGDTVVFGGTASFADKNVGVDKTVAVNGIAASGTDAGNYSLNNTTASTTASIDRKAITVAAAGVNRVYDGSTRAGADLSSGGVVAGDTVVFTGTATLADKNVGTGKAVSVAGIGSNGTDAGNYTLINTTASTTADVTPKTITIAATGVNRVYDGSTAIAVRLASDGVVAGDVVGFDGTGTLADRNAGIGKVVTVAGIGASGADAGNYRIQGGASTTADVARRQLSASLQGTVAKAEDGNAGATLRPANFALQGLVEGDSIAVTQSGGVFGDTSVGKGKVVSTTLGANDYRGNGDTLLSNYETYTGTLSAPVGEIQDAVTTSAAYVAAVNFSAKQMDNAPIVSADIRENVSSRRILSIADGGMRLPAGVVGSAKDASQ